MRGIFFVLLAVNAVFAGWWYLSSQSATPVFSASNMQMNAEKVRIIPPPAIVSAPPQPAAIKKVNVCLEWGVFSPTEINAAQSGIDRLALGERVARREVRVNANYWVYIPPQKNRAELSKRISELKKQGVTGYQSVMEAGVWHFAISLGAYPTEEGAGMRLNQVREKGISQAVSGPREGTATRATFLVRDPSEQVSAKLLELRAEFPVTEIKTVECPPDTATEPAQSPTDVPSGPVPSPQR